jgi:hypothetical protein
LGLIRARPKPINADDVKNDATTFSIMPLDVTTPLHNGHPV